MSLLLMGESSRAGSPGGSRRAAAHEKFLKAVLSPSSETTVKKTNLFGSEDNQVNEVRAALEEIKLREQALRDMTCELEQSRSNTFGNQI